jgi:predicted neuraminidase
MDCMKLLAAALLFSAPLLAQFKIERLFGPETPTGPYKHPSCIEALDNGDLVLVYYGGEGEYAGGTALFMSRKRAGEVKWSQPVQIARDPFYALGNGVIWQAPDKTVWLFYVVRFGDFWSTSRIAARVSHDRGVTWSDPSLLRLDEGWMVRGKPIVLASGKYILPIYHETGSDREIVPTDTTSLFLIYDPSAKKWTPSGRIRSRLGNLQPSPVEISPGKLLAFCRRGGGYSGQKDGWLVRAESADGGMSWTEGRDSEFPNPNSAVELLLLNSGKLLLIYNDSFSDRTPLTAALSSDGGRTWPHKRNLVTGKDSFAYPSAVQTKDGRIHLVFTSNGRKTVTYMSFTEAEILTVR